ncbi:MAG: C4-type zinc ribbon domain-containing protein [Pseudomonadota bacterium]
MLVKLQQIDLDRARAVQERDEIPHQIALLEQELAAAAARLEEVTQEIDSFRKERRALEQEVEDGAARLKKNQSRLLEVKTNQEYKAMLKEMEHLGESNRQKEDRVLELMEKITKAEEQVAVAGQEFAARQKDISVHIAELNAARMRFEEEAGRLEQEREEVVAAIPAELVTKYDFIRSRRNGQAVVPVCDAVCQACYMDIPQQRFNELQKFQELMTCPSCSRIIYWGDAEDFGEPVKQAV